MASLSIPTFQIRDAAARVIAAREKVKNFSLYMRKKEKQENWSQRSDWYILSFF